MKNIFLISFLFFLVFVFSCDDNKSLTPYLLPKKEYKTEVVYGSFINSVSFLFVTDDSGSMSTHKKYLAKNVALFLKPILEAHPYFNYNFALTSMGTREDSKLFHIDLSFVAGECSIEPSLFIKNSQIGPYFSYKGGGINTHSDMICLAASNIQANRNFADENFFEPLKYIAKKTDTELSNFFGKDKILIVFFISDAGGENYVGRLRGSKNISLVAETMQKEALDWLKYHGTNEENIRAYAVIPPKKRDIGCSLDDTATSGGAYTPPKHVYALVEKLNGLSISICDTQWGKHLTDVSKSLLQSIPAQTLYLEDIPQLGTIEVFFNNKKVPEDFEKGWFLDIEKQSVYFGPNFNLSYYKTDFTSNNKDKVVIKYKPMNLDTLQRSE